jgi:hypothetical protein
MPNSNLLNLSEALPIINTILEDKSLGIASSYSYVRRLSINIELIPHFLKT